MNESTVPTETQTIVGKAEVMPSVPTAQSIMPVATDPGSMLAALVSRGADLATLEKFMDLKDRHEKNEARKAYVQAISNFKADAPQISKDKENRQYDSFYTSLGNLLNTVNPVLSKHGLSSQFDIEQGDSSIKVTCIMRHVLGHSESVSMSAPPDTSGKKNPIQQNKSTFTYLRAATFEAITGLSATDATLDDDGNGSGPPVELINEAQLINLAEICESKGYDAETKLAGLASVWKLAKISDMPVAWFEKAQVRLNKLPNNEAAE